MREFHLHVRVFEGVFRSISFNPRILLANPEEPEISPCNRLFELRRAWEILCRTSAFEH